MLAGCSNPSPLKPTFSPSPTVDSLSEFNSTFTDFQVVSQTPNSAGGVDVEAAVVNATDKTFKYVILIVAPYNRVGDEVESDIGSKSDARLKLTGPVEPGSGDVYTWENVWYNYSISTVKIEGAEVIYMDGTTQEFHFDPVEMHH